MEIFRLASSNYDKVNSNNDISKVRSIEQTQIETNSAKEQDKEISKEKLNDTIAKLNNNMQELKTDVRFRYNDKINQMYVDVIAVKSGKIIRKIPTEEVMKLSESMKEAIGIIFDKKS